ncbi:hypothetical protein [Staphylococcus agnetis]|uniref:hypothetical protein n=1 Tax=Staphylococcus agnetis TaxID=985762 RepID=UPI0004E3443C|nr:hypothetical protein [Staphylococcus agnetis]KFE42368.1 hypothetical protein SAGN_03855 [Staphylococcus agnetis]NJH65058.1 hypothetical protein [Staphylococcus agnetis]NJH97571.1 hypothetical protein [Staphylococcus agnetis]PTH46487.1 hypothetical protein BU587_09430 [Staphylococcus agnetis]PTH72768.1 hypothetical protein BU581_06925 [Staphylococcus agnetis]
MFRDLVFYTLGTELDTFFQYFIFELILLTLVGLAIVLITKKLWMAIAIIVALNLVDATIVGNFNATQGQGTLIGQFFLMIVAKFFPTFYEVLLVVLISRIPFLRRKFKLA